MAEETKRYIVEEDNYRREYDMFYVVEKETEKSYIVRINDSLTKPIPKKTMQTGSGYDTKHWHLAIQDDLDFRNKVRILKSIDNLLDQHRKELMEKISIDDMKNILNKLMECLN